MNDFINDLHIENLLDQAKNPDPLRVREIIDKALELKGLAPEETAALLQTEDASLVEAILQAAHKIKQDIYGNRLVLFAPLYIANHCANNCLYCGFRRDNKELQRVALTMDQIKNEVRVLEREGHKRLLMLSGEHPTRSSLSYFMEAIETAYQTKTEKGGEIRRINVEIAPLEVDEYRELRKTGIGTCVLFQETYHHATYKAMHQSGPKKDFARRLTAMHRAQEGGINDVGIGALFGLYDYKYEVLGLLLHAMQLEKDCGVGPHTISVPRLEPAFNAPTAIKPPHPVSDSDFKKLVAVIRMSVPYTGMILSTRENPALRSEVFAYGISQISAGSRTNPGGYQDDTSDRFRAAQFNLGDTRTLDEVILDISRHGHIPSFCTACYRLGRTGKDFMDLAKPGLIQKFCQTNALFTFKEYLMDYAGLQTRQAGEKLIADTLAKFYRTKRKHMAVTRLQQIEDGARDVYI
ncbi:thiamine biosynthesis protein ThiH [Smithella sp. F21]|jgi:2-iminoacetate synthase|nr:thiamine biosynthesis protein ThiH [Smithella sp. F21]HCX01423.1 [FeFe] hydrogenase H-cluster radical SAM maturase HydG [Syntrophaceae bacterium]